MKVKCKKVFYDFKEQKEREVDEVFTATRERFEEIQKKLPSFVEEVEQDKPAVRKQVK